MGFYAENLVFNVLAPWKGALEIDYYRQRTDEVDFIVHTGPGRFLPIEVKYKNEISRADLRGVEAFLRKFDATQSVVVSKNQQDFGAVKEGIFYIPLVHFLLMFG
jgi:predicted AAA+ superfamily ATPase